MTSFWACEKEEKQSVPNLNISDINKLVFDDSEYYLESFHKASSSCGSLLNKVSFSNGMLVFEDESHYDEVLECLENQIDVYNDLFESQFGYLNDDDVNDLIDRTGFSEDQPLIDFENQFSGFISLRADIESKILIWLNNENLDYNNDPDDHPVLDETERALLNINCEVKIGSEIFNACAGEYAKNITCNNSGCCWGGKDKYWWDYTTNKKAKLVVKITGYPWKSKIKSKIVSKKKKGNRWKRWRTNMLTEVGGITRNGNCTSLGPTYASKGPKRRKKLKAKRSAWGAFPYLRVSDNDLNGGFRFVGTNYTYVLPLTPE